MEDTIADDTVLGHILQQHAFSDDVFRIVEDGDEADLRKLVSSGQVVEILRVQAVEILNQLALISKAFDASILIDIVGDE